MGIFNFSVRLFIALTLLSGCSNRQLYENLQQDQWRRCETLPIAQQAACKSRFEKGYEEYKRELDALRIEAIHQDS